MAADYDRILQNLEKSRELLDIFYQKEIADLYMKMGRRQEAEALWQELMEKYGDKQSGLMLATEALRKGDMEGLLRTADRLIAKPGIDSAHFLALFYKSLALDRLGRDGAAEAEREAAECFEQIEDQEKKIGLMPMQVCLRRSLGQYGEALKDLDRMEESLAAEEESAERDALMEQVKAMREDTVRRMDSIAK